MSEHPLYVLLAWESRARQKVIKWPDLTPAQQMTLLRWFGEVPETETLNGVTFRYVDEYQIKGRGRICVVHVTDGLDRVADLIGQPFRGGTVRYLEQSGLGHYINPRVGLVMREGSPEARTASMGGAVRVGSSEESSGLSPALGDPEPASEPYQDPPCGGTRLVTTGHDQGKPLYVGCGGCDDCR